MPEPRAQRTLVKSPPEIWAEISDAGSLARHLGEFGEIRITDQKAETTVVWEGDTARGTVHLEPSGWGTRVTITAEAIAPEPLTQDPPPAAEAEAAEEETTPAEAAEPVADAEPEAVAEAEPEPVAEEPAAEAEPVAEEPTPEPVAATPAPAPRKRGFFARLFRRRADEPAPEPIAVEETPASVAPPAPKPIAVEETPVSVAPPAPAVAEQPAPAVAEAPAPEEAPVADAAPEPEPEPAPVVEPALDGEIVATALDPERIEAVLVGVLDDLGSAHHRPFSRG